MLDQIIEAYAGEELLKADGFDDAIIGICEGSHRLIYSASKCVKILMERDGMEYSDAVEFYDFNVSAAYVGPKTPIWCNDNFEKKGGSEP